MMLVIKLLIGKYKPCEYESCLTEIGNYCFFGSKQKSHKGLTISMNIVNSVNQLKNENCNY